MIDTVMIDTIFANGSIDFGKLEGCSVDGRFFPHGWTNGTEVNVLYNIAKNIEGDILEIGPWLGRSTLAIAAGVRDASNTKSFDTIDYGPTSIAEWKELFDNDFSEFVNDDEIVRNIHCTGGSMGALIENIRRAGLLKYVTTFIRGNFLHVPKRDRYSMIFCDTLHDEHEVRSYSAAINTLLAPGGWLICDDVSDETLGAIVKEYIDCDIVVYSRAFDPYSKFMIARKAA